MAISKEEIIDAISKMSLLELKELVQGIEEKFGISGQAMFAPQGLQVVAPGKAPEEKEEEKVEFDVILKSFGKDKIKVIKEIREITSLGLKEAKELVEKAPCTIKEKIPKEDAEKIKKKLEEVGATIEIK